MGNCLRRFRSRRHASENDRRSNGHTSSNQSQSRHLENDPILHPAPGLSVPYSQLTEEQQVTIATRMALIATLPILHFDEIGDEKIPEMPFTNRKPRLLIKTMYLTRVLIAVFFEVIQFIENGDQSKEFMCVICMIGYVPGDELRKMPMCIHIFHRACIDDWLTRSLTCPSCLQEIPIPSNVPPATTATTTDSETGDTSTIEQRLQSVSPPSIASIREEVLRIKMRSRYQKIQSSNTWEEVKKKLYPELSMASIEGRPSAILGLQIRPRKRSHPLRRTKTENPNITPRQQQMSQSIRGEESQEPREPPQGSSSTVRPPDDVD
ncbi:hypothetical protein ACTXT7_004261 [Hymenolepis weldensis]